MQPRDPDNIDPLSKAPSQLLRDLPQNMMEKALKELVDVIQNPKDYGAISLWMQRNAWTNKYTFLNDSLNQMVTLAAKFHELSRHGLEAEAHQETLNADIQEAKLRALMATDEIKRIEGKSKPTTPLTEDELLERARRLSEQGEMFTKIEQTLIKEGRDPQAVRDAIERLQYEHQKQQHPDL